MDRQTRGRRQQAEKGKGTSEKRVMDGHVDMKRCNMDSDGQTERDTVRVSVCGEDAVAEDGQKVITEDESVDEERQSCQSPVRRSARLKNVCNIPLLL